MLALLSCLALAADPRLAHPAPVLPWARPLPEAAVPALLTLPPPVDVDGLRARGVTFRGGPAGPRHVGPVWPITAPATVLAELARDGVAVEVARPLRHVRPYVGTAGLIQADAMVAAGDDGDGQVLFDIDAGADIFHPHNFRADAGAFSWMDVDGDGELTPDVDGLDLDGDGAVGPPEVLHLLDTFAYVWARDDYTYPGYGDPFDPRQDWLYLDTDGDGERGFGPDAGFVESDPAYGEPLFVPDDADGDGLVDHDERVLQLGTSIFRAIHLAGREYDRGVDLIDFPKWKSDDAYHGAGVQGIIAGGQRAGQRDYTGLLPAADLVVWDDSEDDSTDYAESLAWGKEQGARVFLHEYAWWLDYPLDGTSALETAISSLASEDTVQVCPAGNLGDAGKHSAARSTDGHVSFGIDSLSSIYGTPIGWLLVDLRWIGEAVPSCTLTDSKGNTAKLTGHGAGQDLGDLATWSARSESPRHTSMLEVYAWADGARDEFPGGHWSIDCDVSGPDLDVDAFLSDDVTSWDRGITFTDEVPAGTMCWPSTADGCIAVAAYAGEYRDDSAKIGDLHTWSSRGPRFGTDRTLDIAAPDDPIAPAAWLGEGWTDSVYTPFGGTSGAGPHIAAAAAQILAHDPSLTGDQVRDAMLASATDEGPPGVDDGWGAGKVQTYDAAFGETPALPPAADPLKADVRVGPDCRATVTVVGDRPLEFAWDVGYDGLWDGDPTDGRLGLAVGADPIAVRVDGRDHGYRVGGLAFVIDPPSYCGTEAEQARSCATAPSMSWLGVFPLLLALRRRR
jgi:hypothetical protein